MKLSEIKLNEHNPRDISQENYEKLKKSIQDFPEMLETRPLIIDENNTVIGGNMRLRALQDLGYEDVPVQQVNWDEERKKEFIIKDNVAFGEWDWETLANEWDDLPLNDWGLEVPDIYFTETNEEKEKQEEKSDKQMYVIYIECSSLEDMEDKVKRIEEIGIETKPQMI